ncbi:MAG: hydrogenase nickel incorporation protein HypB [Chitinivibrionales bacterium]|nr:hydrogenase nickel incorporation protein HypB [Chitinivibrionales bacterium]MBD3356285.1 hydrogenase nickel incorporation protein HypB [Chitinivibrionales bacterium]
MCDTCGCSSSIGSPEHRHVLSSLGLGREPASETIDVGMKILLKNNECASWNRARFDERGVLVVNLIGSPGCGKTTIIEAMARRLKEKMVVIEGDVRTRRDTERVIRAGSRAFQIETNGACHLDAHGIRHALENVELDGCQIVVIENVGNLVCPAAYELGEHQKAAILSLPEGDDKVLKYPALFYRIGTLLINKIDLAPYMEFNFYKAVEECKSLNKNFRAFSVSGKTGEGVDEFCGYLREQANKGGAMR